MGEITFSGDLTLRPAAPRDLRVILGWIDSPTALKLWGGHLLTYPPEVEKTWREIGADEADTFTLVDADGNIAGFGQTLPRPPDAVHLGRIILSPQLRGKRVGRVLVQQLIEAAAAKVHPARITLNVYRDNAPAVRLYRSLGFMIDSLDDEHASYHMVLLQGSQQTN